MGGVRTAAQPRRGIARATGTVGGGLGCGSEWGWLDIIGGHRRIPGGEQVVEGAVKGARSSLQEPMSTFLRPLHLLFLGEAPADDEIDGGFGKGSRDGLAVVPTRRI